MGIGLASAKSAERFCPRSDEEDVDLMMQPYAPRVFLSRDNDPEKLAPARPADSSVCVWDLHLQSFERAAWIKHVLRKPEAPDFNGYLAERLHEDA